jgi:adenosylcobinamide kinase / adenosylcobinamide-phosphate guanylyltransferase
MAAAMAAHELILGGARSGKSRLAEARAAAWLATPGQQALLLATAIDGDAEMAARISRHQADRAARLPALGTLEVPGPGLAVALARHSTPQRLLVVDCLTLWLTQLALPLRGPPAAAATVQAASDELLAVLRGLPGPAVLVSNEIGLGVMPLGRETRTFVDALGWLHQAVAAACERVTLVVAGCEVGVKGASR